MLKMKNLLLYIILAVTLLTSCSGPDEPVADTIHNERTLFVYMPWSTNLTGYFRQNLNDLENCIESMGGLDNERIIVFISSTSSEASMFEITYDDGKCRRIEMKNYTDPAFTTEHGLAEILADATGFAPAKRYSMIIGCHGMGWLPVNVNARSRSAGTEPFHWEYDTPVATRFFGGTTSQYQTDITTLAAAIADTGVKMEYILFDDCYMSSIEVAYELKDAADYLIASTCEVMAYGMPYATMGRHLLGTPDYEEICNDFYDFYSTYNVMPCGTLSVTDLSQMEATATMMKHINSLCDFNSAILSNLQALDGYTPAIFYDYGDYVRALLRQNGADSLLAEFDTRISMTVPFKTATERFFTASRGPLPLYRYSGLTTSDPSNSPLATSRTETAWYRATH